MHEDPGVNFIVGMLVFIAVLLVALALYSIFVYGGI